MIDTFREEYWFLSNFYPCTLFADDGNIYPSVEHAYQAYKTTDFSIREKIKNIKKPGGAKRFGRIFEKRTGWEFLKTGIMFNFVMLKFSTNKILQFKLVHTFPNSIVHDNSWGDIYWGICDNIGQNILGKMLMEIRRHFIKKLDETNIVYKKESE
jgi:ribA/ribD-fused uncharacterized protein